MSTEPTVKSPRQVLSEIYVFSPNRDTLGGTSYLIVENIGNILVDCPAWEKSNQQFLIDQGGISCIYLTHRGGIGKHLKQMQNLFDCQVVIQEQEAYLLPEISTTPFEYEIELNTSFSGLWTSGHSPGSSCLYYRKHGGILFTGRHLIPNLEGKLSLQLGLKTFHTPRQLKNVRMLGERFNKNSLSLVFPGANTGYLRGRGYIDNAYEELKQLIVNAKN
jgi:glyoxylase-like metal-dependent hydrolase (beta-lactamase superfamily II)